MIAICTSLFWLSCLLVAYTYVFYPLLLIVWRSFKGSPELVEHHQPLPSVSVLVSAFNEEAVLAHKIENLQRTDYPRERIEFLVGSDGSTDRTAEMLKQAEGGGLKVFLFEKNRGKAAVLNDLAEAAAGEILVLSDANSFYESDAVAHLVRQFRDPAVGGVISEALLESELRTVGVRSETTYWSYENRIKMLESEIGTTLGATGSLYAIRRNLFSRLPTDAVITDDLLLPLQVIGKGFRIAYEPKAIATEVPYASVQEEFRRKSRIAAGNFFGLRHFAYLLHPRYGFAAFALWSHKIIRWCVPGCLLAAILSLAFLAAESSLYFTLAMLGAGVAVLVVAGWIAERLRLRVGPLGLPFHFVSMNLAIVTGFVRFLRNRRKPSWEVRGHQTPERVLE